MSFIEFEGITKRFGGTLALDRVSLSVERGECHALMGENGAGKSTLGRILAGIVAPDSGTLRIGGAVRRFHSPRDGRLAGIGMVHQELAYCPDLSITENLLLGRYPVRAGFLVDPAAGSARARVLLNDIAPELDPSALMQALSPAQRQLVQIAGAVGTGASVLVFDEPTSSLTEVETQRLFSLMRRLGSSGVTIIYISHRMPEVFEMADRISVLRDGRLAGTLLRSEATEDKLVGMMIGRALEALMPAGESTRVGDLLLEIRGLSSPGKFGPVSLRVCAGEIVGIAGLVGSGRSELVQAVFGLDPDSHGSVIVEGNDVSSATTRKRMDAGLALVPEDRRRLGLALLLSCRLNFSLTILARLKRGMLLSRRTENGFLDRYFALLNIKAPSFDTEVSTLSGGNQQKILLARWLARDAKVLILDEPTRGVDVGAKAEIHRLIGDLAGKGVGILVVSSDLPEVLSISTRILVMRRGEIASEEDPATAGQDSMLRAMSGL